MNDIIIERGVCKYCEHIFCESSEELYDEMISHLLSYHPELKKLEITFEFGKSGLVDLIVDSHKKTVF